MDQTPRIGIAQGLGQLLVARAAEDDLDSRGEERPGTRKISPSGAKPES